MNELGRVLSLIESFRAAKASRRDFAEKNGLHPSALSRILRVGALPAALLDELATFERLSRTHLEVLAAAPEERRGALLAQVRAGRSTYRLRARRETTRAPRRERRGDARLRARAPLRPLRGLAGARPREPRAVPARAPRASLRDLAGEGLLRVLAVLVLARRRGDDAPERLVGSGEELQSLRARQRGR